MNILVSNDDGVHAPGIKALYEELTKIAEVTVVAPDRDKSASGKSLTLSSPLRAKKLENGFISVEGTPTDCVHLALTGWLNQWPDMVVSGINAGGNLGDDVLYSGTVAAATEGRFLGLPSLAISLQYTSKDKHLYYQTAAIVAARLVTQLLQYPLKEDTVLNVNVPNLKLNDLKDFKTVRLGQRHRSENMIKATDPRGEAIYWIGSPGHLQDAGEGTDFDAIKQGYVTLTPLIVDITRYDQLKKIEEWSQTLQIM